MPNEQMIETLMKSMEERYQTSEKNLCQLLEEVDPEKLLVIMIASLLTRPAEDDIGDANDTHSVLIEILAYYALPRVFCSSKSRNITPVDTNNCQEQLENILSSKTFVGMGKNEKHLFESPADFLKMHSQVVRGNAYPEQTAGKIAQIQGKFDRWFDIRIGISPSRAIDILFGIVKHAEETINQTMAELREYSKQNEVLWDAEQKEVIAEINGENVSVQVVDKKTAELFVFMCKHIELIPDVLPVCLTDLELFRKVTENEEVAIKGLISLSANTFGQVKSPEDIRKFPLIELADGRVVLSDLSNAMDFLWEAFEKIAKSDQIFYDRRYQKYKSKWVEDKAVTYLKRIFPESAVYQTLDYPDPARDKGSTAELDIVVIWEPFIVLIEVKAKQFRLESQTGDSAKLRSDLKANIEDAYKQALRAIEYIDAVGTAVFNERNTDRTLIVNRTDIYKFFPVSLSLHQLSSISTQLDKTQELGLFKDGNYPFSICLLDFDLLTRTCISPDVLLHYIEKRILLLNEVEEYHGDELDLFSAYLDTRLHRNNLSLPDEKFNMIAFTGYSDKFDQLMQYDRGENVEKPEIKLNVPKEVTKLLKELGDRNDSGSRMIAFVLLELDNTLLNTIAKAIVELKSQNIRNGIFQRVSFSTDEVVVSIVASNSSAVIELSEKARQRVLIEKYRRKLNKSIGIAIVCERGEQVLETAIYSEFTWEADPDMEELIIHEAPSIPSTDVRMPGVNQPCICGSGKKFKKCCMRKIEDSRRKYPLQ